MAETVPTSSLSSDDEPSSAPSIDSLRARLIRARAARGACPPLFELQLDGLPADEPRPGRDERAQHLDRCDVCQENLLAWRASWEGRAAQLLAWAKIGGRRLGEATERAARGASKMPRSHRPRPAIVEPPAVSDPSPPPIPTYRPPAPNIAASAPAPAPSLLPMPSSPSPSRARRSRVQRASNEPLPSLIVLEAPLAGVIPAALVHAAVERGAAVVTVESAEEAIRDPDFGSVRAIVLTRSRPLAEWEKALASVRARAPGRIVMAIVAAPRLGPAAVTWRRDPGILNPPVGDGDWAAALVRMGWTPPS
jgi:hypothetical protein